MAKYTLVAPPKAKYTLVAPPPMDENPQAMMGEEVSAPRYFTNPADQAIAETPVVRQVFRGAANTLDTVKSMALRGKAVFNSAIDDRGGAYDALKQADAIDAEKARREEQFQKTSGTAGNIGAGVVESLTLAAPAAMMGGAPAAIGAASASQGNQAYYEGKQAGLTGTDLAQHVAMQTLLEGAPATMSQVAGVGGLEKRLAALGEPVQRGVKAALARFGKTSLEEWPEELTTTLIEQIGAAQAGVGTATPQDLANGAFQTTLQTLATAGLVESPSIARGAVDAMRRPPAPPSSDAPANAVPTGDMNLTLTPEQPVTQSDVADIFAMFDEPAAQPAAGAPTPPVARRTPDTLPPLPPGAEIPVQGITAPTAPAENPRVAPIAPGSAVLRPVPTLTPETTNGPIQAIHYSRTPMSLSSDADISKIEGAYSAYEDSTFGSGFYAMEPSDETMWKSMDRFDLGPHRNEVQIKPKNPLVISPETVKQRGFDAINEALQSGNHDAIISRGWGDADMRMAVHRRTRQLWKPKLPEGKTEGRFTNVDEFNAAREQAIREVTGINPSDYDKLTKADWDQNQIFVPTKKAPEVVSGATQREPSPNPPTHTPIRFKRSGKGNAAVHEATVEGRAVSIAKGKDGWEVRLDGEVADVLPTLADARGYATGELRQDLVDQRNAAEEERYAANEVETAKPLLAEPSSQEEIAGVNPGEGPQIRFERADGNRQTMTFRDVSVDEVPQATRDYLRENINRGGYSQEQVVKYSKFLMGKEKLPARISDLGDGSEVSFHLYENKDEMNEEFYRFADPDSTRFYNRSLSPKAEKIAADMKKKKDAKASEAEAKRREDDAERKRMLDAAVEFRNRTDAYPLPKGKKSRVQIAMDEGVPIVADMTVYDGVLGVRKQEGKYRVTHVPTGLAVGKPIDSLSTAQRAVKGLLDSGVDLKKSEFSDADKKTMRDVYAFLSNVTDRPPGYRPTGPAPADTGIYRDLTAAAREGKRFVAELHERIAPALERIYAQSRNAVDFVKQAVAKIGKHIRPYAKRFAAEVKRGVRATNAEFRQNPTRGSVPIEGKASEQAPMAKAPKGEETRASGLAQGQREGVNRQRSDTKAMFALAKEVLPPDEWKAIAKTGRKIASIKGKSEAAQRRALNRILERKMGEIEHARALKSAKASIKKARKGFKKLRPEVQAVIDEVLRGKRVKGVSQAAYDRMLQLVAEVTAGTRTGVSPTTLARASKAISDFENPDLQDMKDMTAEELSGIADQIEQALQLNDSLNEGLAAERERQKVLNKQAPKEVEARTPVALQNIAFENNILRSISEGTLSLSNIVRGIVGKGGHVFKTLVSDLVEADTKTLMYLRKHTEMTMARLREAGITPDKLAAMSRTLNPKAGEVEVAGVKMTKGERISLLLHLADPNTRASLLNPKSKGFEFSRAESGPNRTLKVTEEVARAIEESATPDERKVASIFWDWANGDLRDDVNEWSRRVLGYDMFTSDQHWNRRRKITDGEPAVGLLAGDFNTAQQEAGAYLKERTGGTSPIVVDDAFQHFSSHVNATSALMGKFEASVNARRLLATNEFQQAIKKNRRTGDLIFGSINKRINDWGSIAPPKSNDRLLGAVRWLGRRYSAAKLSVNLPVIISQPFSILSAAKIIPMKHITKAILGGETVRESVKREIAETPEAADLHYIINGGGHHVVTPGSITGTTAGQIFGTEKDSPLERSMVLIQRGNNVAVSGIWRAAKAWGREQGLTGDELMKFTAKTARDAWLQTQPSNSSVYHPGLKISARTNSIAYAMTMFQGQTSIQFQDAIDAIRDYQELPAAQQTAAEKAKVLAKAARPIVLQAILFYGLKYGMEKSWEELFGRSDSKKKSDKKLDPAYDKLLDIAKSPATSIPGIGPVLDGIIDFAKRKATGQAVFGSAFDNPVVDAAGNIMGLPGHLVEAAQAYRKDKEVPVSAIRGMLSAGEAVTGLPINNLRGWIEGIDRAVRDKR